ncbi:MAG: methyltransferase domain-containing protein [Verrucomicrobiota bacterium JB023]|nr:methyltransferase domain-containing protein [Verrucomicrobiota bacterium JB023]
MDWNERYRTGDTPWDKGTHAPALEEIDRAWDFSSIPGKILVPGCGAGHDARWLTQQGARVLALDIAPLAIEMARENLAGLPAEVREGDFFKPEPESVDAIFEHTCFCAIEPERRRDYARAAASWLAPRGVYFGLFFLNPDGEEGPPYGCTLAELDELFGQSFEILAEWQPEAAYPGREGREWVRILRRTE